MFNDEPQNDNSQQGETVESITLASLLENPDPDFDVVVTQRSSVLPRRIELATDDKPPPPSKTERR